jgi:DNA invertase Pin-like site-specific DNA recombinase
MSGADDLMMRIYAAMAQRERELIGERRRAALAAVRVWSGMPCGDHRPPVLPVPLRKPAKRARSTKRERQRPG